MEDHQQPTDSNPADGQPADHHPADGGAQDHHPESPDVRQESNAAMNALGGATMGQAQAALEQIGEEGERLPEGYKPDGVISLETYIDMKNIWSVFDL